MDAFVLLKNVRVNGAAHLGDEIAGIKPRHGRAGIHQHIRADVVDGAAVREYYLTVEDEGHILLVVPPEGSTNQFRYAIGNKANQVIDSKAMQYLLSQVRYSRDGKYWKTKICEFADKLIS